MRQQYNRQTNTLRMWPEPTEPTNTPMVHQSHGIAVQDLEGDAWKAAKPVGILSIVAGIASTIGWPTLGWLIRLLPEVTAMAWLVTLTVLFMAWWLCYAYFTFDNRKLITSRYIKETERIQAHNRGEVDDDEDDDGLDIADPANTYTRAEAEVFGLCAVLTELYDGKRTLIGGQKIHVSETGELIDAVRQREYLDKLKRLDIADGGHGATWRVKYLWPTLDNALDALDDALNGRPIRKPGATP